MQGLEDEGVMDQQITCHTGMNVTLKFPVSNGTTSLWLKRAGSDKYISYCQDRIPTRPEDQEESFKGRVEGMDCDKINGTVTVTLSNLTISDSGTYEFHRVDSDGRRFNETIFLNVTDPGPRGRATEDETKEEGGNDEGLCKGCYLFAGLVALLLVPLAVIAVKAFKVCTRRMKKDLNNLPPPDEEQPLKLRTTVDNQSFLHQNLLNSALSVAKTTYQEVMERDPSFTLVK